MINQLYPQSSALRCVIKHTHLKRIHSSTNDVSSLWRTCSSLLFVQMCLLNCLAMYHNVWFCVYFAKLLLCQNYHIIEFHIYKICLDGHFITHQWLHFWKYLNISKLMIFLKFKLCTLKSCSHNSVTVAVPKFKVLLHFYVYPSCSITPAISSACTQL